MLGMSSAASWQYVLASLYINCMNGKLFFDQRVGHLSPGLLEELNKQWKLSETNVEIAGYYRFFSDFR